MFGEVFGVDGLIILLVPVSLGLALWALIDASIRPERVFKAAGKSKVLWITLPIGQGFRSAPWRQSYRVISVTACHRASSRSGHRRGRCRLRHGAFAVPSRERPHERCGQRPWPVFPSWREPPPPTACGQWVLTTLHPRRLAYIGALRRDMG